MKIYTKTGDKGQTSLLGGSRVSKASLRIECYGTVDELNSCLGLVKDQEANHSRREFLTDQQNKLFVIGSNLAAEPGKEKFKLPEIEKEDITQLEKAIDGMDATLPPMRNFILPGGHPSISVTHVCRCVCRRAERLAIALNETEEIQEEIIAFLNRLSDYLFVLCRKLHQELGVEETPWKSR